MVTIKEIARRAGVSRGTVDRVLNGRPGVKPETEARVRALMDELGYHPDQAGQMLAARKKKLRIAFLILHGPEFVFFLDILHAARDKAADLRELGVTVDFYLIRHLDQTYLERLFLEVEESRPDGIVTLPFRVKPFVDFMERMHGRGVPTVFFNVDGDFVPRMCYVGCDYVRSGRVAAGLAALCTGGYGKVGVASFDSPFDGFDSPSFTHRMGGFTQELRASYPGLTLADGGAPAFFRGSDFSAVEDLLRRHPDLAALYLVNLGDFSVCRAAREAAGDRPLVIITNDLIPAQREMLREGVISATVSQQPDVQGSAPLQALYDLLVFGTQPASEHLYTDLLIYISQNV